MLETSKMHPDVQKKLKLSENYLLDSFSNSENYISYIKNSLKFRQYSVNNRNLIKCQKPDAVYVASEKTWKELGYEVNKEEGIGILMPYYLKMYKDANGWWSPIKYANKQVKDDIRNKKIPTESVLYSYSNGVVYDIAATNANESDLTKLVSKSEVTKTSEDILEQISENGFTKNDELDTNENIKNFLIELIKDIQYDSQMKKVCKNLTQNELDFVNMSAVGACMHYLNLGVTCVMGDLNNIQNDDIIIVKKLADVISKKTEALLIAISSYIE